MASLTPTLLQTLGYETELGARRVYDSWEAEGSQRDKTTSSPDRPITVWMLAHYESYVLMCGKVCFASLWQSFIRMGKDGCQIWLMVTPFH